MARPERNNVDYFPFYCDEGNKMFYIEETYGNDGFATFIKILRELGKTDYHYLDLSKNTTLMFLSAKCKISKDVLLNIVSDLVDLEKFNRFLWQEKKIIWCQDFIDSIQDAYSRRNNKCITFDGLCKRLSIKCSTETELLLKIEDNKPQSIVEYIKEEETIPKDANISNELIENILSFFGFTVNNPNHKHQQSLVFNFLKIYPDINYFKIQFEAYKKLKTKEPEYIHKIHNFLGTQSELFKNGKWLEENWVEKLKSFKPKKEEKHQEHFSLAERNRAKRLAEEKQNKNG